MSPFVKIVRCPRCNQPVYAAEEVLAGGRKYHKICFKCGLCGKTLSSTNLMEHEGNIYCKQCYSRLFGPRGVGFGTGAGSLSMDRGENFRMSELLQNYQQQQQMNNRGDFMRSPASSVSSTYYIGMSTPPRFSQSRKASSSSISTPPPPLANEYFKHTSATDSSNRSSYSTNNQESHRI